ncbi:MAG: U32 family peptidase [Arenicellales bacterium]|jgi:collagenase-like PrtC family protease|nr:U32 family peptidase [Arenicellales bacterium]MDP7521289.1 U32 family peptidase [Arenicellales bacterium]|tara:strand:+ start:1031 stop:1963 length:933 start_codon:yes stop_codon:yes gene_type:complete
MAIMPIKRPRLALGPLSYFWTEEQLLEFYQQIAGSPVDIVYLGETICSKRRSLDSDQWLTLGRTLQEAGKEVVLSTLTLIEAGSELGALHRLCQSDEFLIEANDLAAVQLLKGKSFVAGPATNIYNQRTLSFLTKMGMRRWVPSVELGHEPLVDLQENRPEGVETELLVWGRLPLAYSARCYTARAHNLPKDDCQLRCLDYPDGMLLSTREEKPFLTINGIQTQSALTQNLSHQFDNLCQLGVDVLRISPQSRGTLKVIDLFDDLRNQRITVEEVAAWVAKLAPLGSCDGYWHGEAGMEKHLEQIEGASS